MIIVESSKTNLISRRDFLKMLGAVALVSFDVVGLTKLWPKLSSPDINSLDSYLDKHKEYLPYVNQLMKSRLELGLTSFPKEVSTYQPDRAVVLWNEAKADFSNQLPPTAKKVGQVTELFLQTVYEPAVKKTIKGIKNGEGTYFDLGDRFIGYPQFYGQNKLNFLMTMAHEGAGHGVDPGPCSYYPPEMFFKLEAAKWRMLSRAFSVEGQLLNLPEDSVHKQIYAYLGRTAVEAYVKNPEFSKLLGSSEIRDLVSEVKPEDAKFTKRLVYIFGQRVHKEMMSGKKFFLQEGYENQLTNSLVEIYAEMVKWTLISPSMFPPSDTSGIEAARKIQADKEIFEGVKETVEIIRGGTVDMERLKNTLTNLYDQLPDVLEEIPASPKLSQPTSTSAPTLTPEQVVYQRANELTTMFLKGREIPEEIFSNLDTESRSSLGKYLNLCRIILGKYPRAGEEHLDPEMSIEAFDPPTMNFWETEEITASMKNSVFKEVFLDALSGKGIKKQGDYIKQGTIVLQKFIETDKISFLE